MENTTGQYNVSIFPCSGTGDALSAAVRMEVASGFEAFYREVMERKTWGKGCEASEARLPGAYKLRICDGVGEDFYSFCEEEGDIIAGLLYCCIKHGVTVREIAYKESRYTDISEAIFLETERIVRKAADPGDDTEYIEHEYPVRVYAKKDGYDTAIDFFGLRMTDDDSIFHYDSKSRGVVEAKENQIHIGMYGYSWSGCYYDDEWNLETGELVITDREVPYDVEDQGHVFFEADGNNVTFSMLLDGKLYPEIVKTDGKVIFYDTHLFVDECAGGQSITNFLDGGTAAELQIFRQPCRRPRFP